MPTAAKPDTEKTFKSVDDILAIDDTKTKDIWVEEWGTYVTIQGLTKQQQLEIRKRSIVNGEIDMEKVQAGMFREGVTNPTFPEEVMPRLFQKNAGVIDSILTEVLTLSGMKEGALREKEAGFSS